VPLNLGSNVNMINKIDKAWDILNNGIRSINQNTIQYNTIQYNTIQYKICLAVNIEIY